MTSAIERIHSFERFGSILGLERMKELMDRLGNPQESMKFIHVAGTNGKGSVCRFIYEILKANSYKAGIFTSPYINVFNERIEFNGQYITDGELEICFDEVVSAINEMTGAGFDSPTEFEVLTAVAFVYFKKKKAEIVVLEVGLGGKGDSTNIIKAPLVSIITSISLDHMDRLGNTTREIAGEKAGIIKEGAPVVSNIDDPDAAKVVARTAYWSGCVLRDVTGLKYRNLRKSIESYLFDTEIDGNVYNDVEITMLGEHQIRNAMTALSTIETLRKAGKLNLKKEGIYAGLKCAKLPGRFEILKKKPYYILDGAHNENGAAALAHTMKEHFRGEKILMVTGILADKDLNGILKHFYELTDDFIATEPTNARKLPAETLNREIRAAGKNCMAIQNSAEACEKAIEISGKYDVVLFAGSLYLLEEIRSVINGQFKN